MHKNNFFAESVTPYLRSMKTWPRNLLGSVRANPKRVTIDMKWEAYQKLSLQRQQALENTVLFSGEDDFVPAKFDLDGDSVRVRMRLKGDGVNHLLGEKWSFRVKTRGTDAFLGMKQFSLHHPQVRNWLFEWLGHRMLRREDVVSLRYDFLNVTLNGKELGLYALEEHFEKRLIESNSRREGPILRFNEELMWREIAEQTRPFPGAETNGIGDYQVSDIEGFQTARILEDPKLKPLYVAGVKLLEAFRRGDLTTSQVFDSRTLAIYFALVDLLGAEHGSRWHNIRFYYNPVTSKLEPIAFDLFGGRPTKALSITGMATASGHDPFATVEARFQKQVFEDPVFCAEYLAALERVSRPQYLDDVLKELDPAIQKSLAILHTEFPYYEFSPDVLQRNQAYIRSVLDAEKSLHAYVEKLEDAMLTLQVANIRYLPVEVTGVEIQNGPSAPLENPYTLQPRQRDRIAAYRSISAPLPPSPPTDANQPLSAPAFTVVYKVLGTQKTLRSPVSSFSLDVEEFLRNDFLRRPPDTNVEFLTVDESTKTLRIKPGRWTIATDVILPGGYTVVGGPGTELDLVQGALLLSHSPLQLHGEEESPVVIRSSDGEGQGVVVMQPGRPSELEHVHFLGLNNPKRTGWTLTGAVTFYENEVSFRQCVFGANHCEDALNLIRGPYVMDSCLFQNTQYDAFDADFCRGRMSNMRFENCGNDCLDVSGSVVDLQGIAIVGAKDKGISVGEASNVTADALDIRMVRIGMASKDRSELRVERATLNDCEIGTAVFQKKPEFGGGTMIVRRLTMNGVRQPYLVEEGSELVVDGDVKAPTDKNVKELVYGKPAAPPP